MRIPHQSEKLIAKPDKVTCPDRKELGARTGIAGYAFFRPYQDQP